MAQDSSKADFWDARFRGGVTPWDAAGVPRQLVDGHDVLAIEFSDAAIDAAKRELGPLFDRVKKADFFDFESPPFDVVYERAFLCALPRRIWPQWASRVAQLVRPGGELAGFFYLDDNEHGPPFGIAPQALHGLLDEAFELKEDQAIPPSQSLLVFQGKERWQVWQARP